MAGTLGPTTLMSPYFWLSSLCCNVFTTIEVVPVAAGMWILPVISDGLLGVSGLVAASATHSTTSWRTQPRRCGFKAVPLSVSTAEVPRLWYCLCASPPAHPHRFPRRPRVKRWLCGNGHLRVERSRLRAPPPAHTRWHLIAHRYWAAGTDAPALRFVPRSGNRPAARNHRSWPNPGSHWTAGAGAQSRCLCHPTETPVRPKRLATTDPVIEPDATDEHFAWICFGSLRFPAVSRCQKQDRFSPRWLPDV